MVRHEHVGVKVVVAKFAFGVVQSTDDEFRDAFIAEMEGAFSGGVEIAVGPDEDFAR